MLSDTQLFVNGSGRDEGRRGGGRLGIWEYTGSGVTRGSTKGDYHQPPGQGNDGIDISGLIPGLASLLIASL